MNPEVYIELKQLNKKFKGIHAVNNLDLQVYKGDVYGFLGPNGAGKSTTIRMLLTLITPDSGSIQIFNQPLLFNRNKILRKVGAFIEKPDFYNYLSAYKNLEILCKYSGLSLGKRKIMETLEMVGLDKRADSKVKTYSQGMKQRLGIAQALIHEPELIILDEPGNGLDPQGTKDIRDLILFLNKEQGRTIFISSHILSEIELIANRMIIIDKGSKVVEGLVKELLDPEDLKVRIDVDDPTLAKQLIGQSRLISEITECEGNKLFVNMKKENIHLLNKYLVENGIEIHQIMPIRSLEEYFLGITN